MRIDPKKRTPPPKKLLSLNSLLGTQKKRKRISAKRRARIMERDGNACFYCGSTEDLQVDHVVAFSAQGSDDDSNLVTACGRCNRAKSASSSSHFQTKQLDKRLNP